MFSLHNRGGRSRQARARAALVAADPAIVRELVATANGPVPTSAISRELEWRALWPDRFARLTAVLASLAAAGPDAEIVEQRYEDPAGRTIYY